LKHIQPAQDRVPLKSLPIPIARLLRCVADNDMDHLLGEGSPSWVGRVESNITPLAGKRHRSLDDDMVIDDIAQFMETDIQCLYFIEEQKTVKDLHATSISIGTESRSASSPPLGVALAS